MTKHTNGRNGLPSDRNFASSILIILKWLAVFTNIVLNGIKFLIKYLRVD